jgi:hypothetical protein
MLPFCACPEPEELPAIVEPTCGEDYGQIVKFVFQRRQATPSFATLAAAGLIANWTTLKSAADATKVVTTPFFENYVLPPVEAITEGGDDNTTLFGSPRTVGETSPVGTGNFVSLPAATFEELRAYVCFKNLTVFMINEYGKIIGRSPNGTTFTGIPIIEFYIGDKGLNGKNTLDKNMFRVPMRAGWSLKNKIITPTDFDALYDLN